jgi:hypothetical protein
MNSNPQSGIGSDDLSDPNIDAQTLARLAETRPDLWPAIQRHPNCYPQLQQWISQNLGQQPTASGQQPPHDFLPTPEQWAAEFQRTNGREPTMSEFREAQAQGAIARERKPTDPSMQQMSQGARQLAEGARGFFTQRVAPTAVGAARTVQSSVGDQVGQARKSSSWQAWVPIALPAFAVIGLIALFFPAATASASGFGFSVLGLTDLLRRRRRAVLGWWLLILHLAVLGFGVTAIANRAKWARITAGTAGVVVGLIAAFSGFGIIGAASSFGGSSMGISASASPGPGAVILAIASLGMLAAAVLTLLTLRGTSKPELSQND